MREHAFFPPGSKPHGRHDPRRRLLVFSVHFEMDAGPASARAQLDLSTQIVQGATVLDRECFTMLAQRCESAFLHPVQAVDGPIAGKSASHGIVTTHSGRELIRASLVVLFQPQLRHAALRACAGR